MLYQYKKFFVTIYYNEEHQLCALAEKIGKTDKITMNNVSNIEELMERIETLIDLYYEEEERKNE